VVLLVPVVGDVRVVDTVEQGRPSQNKLKQMILLTQGLYVGVVDKVKESGPSHKLKTAYN
jgi:hypothetical protein